jgi:hypothetical protein
LCEQKQEASLPKQAQNCPELLDYLFLLLFSFLFTKNQTKEKMMKMKIECHSYKNQLRSHTNDKHMAHGKRKRKDI